MAELRKLTFSSETEAKKNIVATVKSVAERLGNTPAVCRKAYVHPASGRVVEQSASIS